MSLLDHIAAKMTSDHTVPAVTLDVSLLSLIIIEFVILLSSGTLREEHTVSMYSEKYTRPILSYDAQ
jgi:hypothetical protein